MKSELNKDYSGTGNAILAERIRGIFKKRYPDSEIWMPDVFEWPEANGKKTVDVIFFGDFFRKFLESGNWTFENARIWCLGSPAKKFLVNMMGLKDSEVSIIPRELIFPVNTNETESGFNDLIYAGRISPSKRILTMIWTSYFLQKKGKADVSLKLFGEFIQEEKYCECPGENPYERHVRDLIQELDWTNPPVLGGKVSPDLWVNQKFNRPNYFSLSVLPFEDYSVSIAQAQEKAWPVIVSNWGAHNDLFGKVLKVPVQLFQSLYETEESAKQDGELVCDYILQRSLQNVLKASAEMMQPTPVSLKEVDSARRQFLQKWGMNFQDVIRHRTEDLKNQENWKNFMKEYVKCFIS